MGLHYALQVHPLQILRASGTTCGIPRLWDDPRDIALTRLWAGWETTSEERWARIRRLGIAEREDQRREEELLAALERIAKLERENATLKRTARRNRPAGPATRDR